MRRITFLLIMFMAVVLRASADDYGYLVFQTADGTEQSVSVTDLKIVVSGTTLVATNASETQTYTLTDLSKMYFSSTITAIASATAADEQGEVSIYGISGLSYGKFASVNAAKSKLSPGIYVVKGANKTYKIAVQ